MDGLCLGATLAALLGLGAGGEAAVGPANKFAFDGGRFTLDPGALGARFTLSTYDPAAGSE